MASTFSALALRLVWINIIGNHCFDLGQIGVVSANQSGIDSFGERHARPLSDFGQHRTASASSRGYNVRKHGLELLTTVDRGQLGMVSASPIEVTESIHASGVHLFSHR